MAEHRSIEIVKEQVDAAIESYLRSISVIGDDEDIGEILWPMDMEELVNGDNVTLEFTVTPMLRTRRPRKDDE